MQAETGPGHPLLYSLSGFQYCDLLLAASQRAAWQTILQPQTQTSELETAIASCRAVSHRAAQTLNWVTDAKLDFLSIALDHLTLARAALYEAILEKSEIRNPKSEIEQAVDGLRRAGQQFIFPHSLVTRAWLRFLTGARTGPESAQEDLDEA